MWNNKTGNSIDECVPPMMKFWYYIIIQFSCGNKVRSMVRLTTSPNGRLSSEEYVNFISIKINKLILNVFIFSSQHHIK